jgi:putative SOS response-associated peptidase YedK
VCGRYSLRPVDPAALRARFPIGESLSPEPPYYNITPSSDVLAVTTDREGLPRGERLRWGLVPNWAKDTKTGFKMINARAETLVDRPAYRNAFERFRCLIPADGFYEWQQIPGEKRKQPFHITTADGGLFAFAGLWSVWHRGEPEELRSCTIITTAANSAVAPVHDRMPVILPRRAEQLWLAHDAPLPALEQLLRGLGPEEMAMRRVGPAVNDARYDGPECLLDPPPPAQEALFAK